MIQIQEMLMRQKKKVTANQVKKRTIKRNNICLVLINNQVCKER